MENKKYYEVVKGYESEVLFELEEAEKWIKNDLERHEDLNPVLISKSESVYKTFREKEIKITTLVYLYKTRYTEVYTIYEGVGYFPISDIQHDLEVQKLRKEWQPQLEKDVKEFKKWVEENGWSCKISDAESILLVNCKYSEAENCIGVGECFTLGTEERHIIDSYLRTEESKKFMNQALEKFINIEGFLKDILAAF